MKLIVYHIYCVNNYKEIVKNQLIKIMSSGLYDWCDVLEVTVVGNNEDFAYLKNILSFEKIKISFFEDNKKEFYALDKIWNYSQKHQGKVLYFHTKGVWNNFSNHIEKKPDELKSKSVVFWREIMEYFLLENYKNCLDKLDDFDNCGVTCNGGWYWGNFWWSNLSYLKENPRIQYGSRWLCEVWLNKDRRYKSFEFFHYDYNPYFTYLPKDIYKNKKEYFNNMPKLRSAFYGTLGIQMDEGWPIYNKKLIEVTDKLKIKGVVNNDSFGDPSYGQIKNLIINFEYKNEIYSISFNENNPYDLTNYLII